MRKKPPRLKTRISYFYLIRQFPLQTFFHYVTGLLSAILSGKILGTITKYVSDKEKTVNIGQLKDNFWEIIGRLAVVYGIIVFIHIIFEIYLVEIYSSHLRKKLAKKYLQANFSQTQKEKFILSNYQNEAITVGTKAAQIFNRCFYAVVAMIILFWEIQEANSWIMPWLLLSLLILTVSALMLYQFAYRFRWQRTKKVQQENKYFEELKENTEYIKITGTEREEIQENNRLIEKNLDSILYLAISKSLFATIPNYLLLKILPVFFLIAAHQQGAGTAELFLLYIGLNNFFAEWKKFFEELWSKGGYDTYSSSLKQLNKGFAILDTPFSPPTVNYLPEKVVHAVTLENINFTYPETNKKVLNNFSFVFQTGKKYAIIGPNGVGKSTLFKLIVKLYQPQRGDIKLNDVELNKIATSTLREKIIYLPNSPFFFNTSLGNNIVYPDLYQENIHKEKLEKIAKKLGIKEFVDKLPNRWETIIAEKGQNLSEGQKQLVSLMRALVKDYEIYLFDEFLSNINNDLKEKILPVIFRELSGKTVIVISHDPTILSYLDETYQFAPQKLIKK